MTATLRRIGISFGAVILGLIMAGSGLFLFLPAFLFAPFILAGCIGDTALGLSKVARGQPFTLHDGTAGLFFGRAWAVPLSIVALPAAQLLSKLPLAPDEGYLTAAVMALLALTLAFAFAITLRQLQLEPAVSDSAVNEHLRGIPLGIVMFGMITLGISVLFTAPVASMMLGRHLLAHENSSVQSAASIFLVLSLIPAALTGIAFIRVGLGLQTIRRLIANVATSTIQGAAMGLVELKGEALRLPGGDPAHAFLLKDGTGQVMVHLPERHDPPAAVSPGSTVYLLGEYTNSGGQARVRSWRPPYGRYLLPLLSAMLGQITVTGFHVRLDNLLAFHIKSEIFVLRNGPESQVKNALVSQIRKAFLYGGILMLSLAVWAAWIMAPA